MGTEDTEMRLAGQRCRGAAGRRSGAAKSLEVYLQSEGGWEEVRRSVIEGYYLFASPARRGGTVSLGIVFKGPEGIVLAADSRVTLNAQIPGQNFILPVSYDNATKLLHVSGQDYVGAVTYGVGALGQQQPRTAHSFIPEFEDALLGSPRLSVQEFAQRLSDFFANQWKANMPANYQGPDMVFLVGGYDQGAPYGRVFQVLIPSTPAPQEMNAAPGDFGLVWGGQKEFTDRLLQGFDDSLPAIAQQFLHLTDQHRDTLRNHLRGNLIARIPYQFLP